MKLDLKLSKEDVQWKTIPNRCKTSIADSVCWIRADLYDRFAQVP